jgi:hypothetical protein
MKLRGWLFAAVLLVLSGQAAAQDLVPDEPTCARCTITLREIVTLRDTAAAHMPGKPLNVKVDGLGRYWLTYPGGAPLPLIYGPDGRFLRELGRRGEGPGEYLGGAMIAALPGDSVLVFDRNLLVLRPDLTVARTITQAMSTFALEIFDWPRGVFNKLPGNVEMPGPVYVRKPFQMVDLSGPTPRVLRSFGAGFDIGVTPSRTPYQVWVWDYSPYRIEKWSSAGERVDAIERHPSWFPEGERPAPQRNQLPPAHLQWVQEDSQGLVWVFISYPVGIWPEGAGPITREMEKYFRTRVEVIDPNAGRVVVSTVLDRWIVSPLPGGQAAVYGTNAQGTPFIQIVQLTLLR